MILAEAPKTFWDIAGAVWTGAGPLLGVLVGALLARSWDHKKWMNDNRKEECRELLTAMTKVADLALEARAQIETHGRDRTTSLQNAWAEERKCLIVLQDRIFIAKQLEKNKVSGLWKAATTDYMTDGDAKKFGDKLNEVKEIILDIAMRG